LYDTEDSEVLCQEYGSDSPRVVIATVAEGRLCRVSFALKTSPEGKGNRLHYLKQGPRSCTRCGEKKKIQTGGMHCFLYSTRQACIKGEEQGLRKSNFPMQKAKVTCIFTNSVCDLWFVMLICMFHRVASSNSLPKIPRRTPQHQSASLCIFRERAAWLHSRNHTYLLRRFS